jgi:hypothetical protein
VKIDKIKEEVTHDMENLRKKDETEIQNTMEGNPNSLEQVEERVSECEDKMEIKGKTRWQLEGGSRQHELHKSKLAEMLEPHLAEKKHQEEAKL